VQRFIFRYFSHPKEKSQKTKLLTISQASNHLPTTTKKIKGTYPIPIAPRT